MRLTKDAAGKILSRFDSARILVIGDLILDEFIWGKADRISPEAPVPVVWAQSQSYMPGGASNVANNVASLGAKVFLCGVIGDDKNGRILTEKLREKNVNCDAVLVDPIRPTTVKTRIIASHQQMVRVDWENTESLSKDMVRQMTEAIGPQLENIDAVIIEDYGKGVITPALLKNVISLARRHGKIITVDPKVEHFSYYKGVTAMTPNEKEASAGSGIKITDDDDVDAAGWKLLKKLKLAGILITLGEKGMKLFSSAKGGGKGTVVHIPTVAQEVFDVSGAGDTVISVFTLALASGVKMREAAVLANVAAGVVVGKVGVAVISKEELLEALARLKGRFPWM
ncbi:MAG TPA: D-glycero-beta-D-manno-heptose-7-phosphate kinase [Candidatus Omnitrophica bacterium]|nr:D-glycero-beta-D-manno-heptose-7-phosphate kinase [Candidatus Omnitrophota bacterium]